MATTDLYTKTGAYQRYDFEGFSPSTYGSLLQYWALEEEVTIPVGGGAAAGGTGPVETTFSIPASSYVLGAAFRVTQAPGGGAATVDIGPTSGVTDALIDGKSCDVLGETGTSADSAGDQMALLQAAADTVLCTTNADVTGTAMKLRVCVWGYTITAPTS